MKNRTEENRRNLEMIAPTWTMLGLALAACGGGGGGGSSGFGGRSPLTTPQNPPATTPRLSGVVEPAPQFGVGGSLSATTGETNDIAEIYALRWDTAIAVLDIFGTYELDVTPETVTLTARSSFGGSATTASWTITGADADDFIFVQDGAENAVLQTVNPVDYENPRDANRDNVYEITLDAQGGTFGVAYNHILSTGDVDYTITITDVVGVDQHSENVDEGEVMILTLDDLGITQATISGVDAADVEIAEVNGEMVVRFRSAPDFDAPADSDSDNVYEFTLTDTATEVETHIEVTVMDVV